MKAGGSVPVHRGPSSSAYKRFIAELASAEKKLIPARKWRDVHPDIVEIFPTF